MPAEEGIAHVNTARSVLEGWAATYAAVRQDIETQGRDARWEFPRAPLFDKSTYMSEICAEVC